MYNKWLLSYLHAQTIQQLGYEKHVIHSKLCYYKPKNKKHEQSLAEAISKTLTQEPKFISPKFFYNETGSKLFEKICKLPEYYLTRTETKILQNLDSELTDYIPQNIRLVELGSGSSAKTRLLLDKLDKVQDKIEYIPIDISEILKESSQRLQKHYDNLHITGIIDSYEKGLKFIKELDKKQNLIVFLGSSFGNFEPEDGCKFLEKVNSTMNDNDFFLIGLDLVKNKTVLEEAYNDSQGVTAEFNLNMLSRINEELDADFNLASFDHHALYNEEKQRIEMYLRSLEEQSVHIKKVNLFLVFQKDELIHTEYSHKYSIPQIKEFMKKTGFKINAIWQDDTRPYALVLVSKNN